MKSIFGRGMVWMSGGYGLVVIRLVIQARQREQRIPQLASYAARLALSAASSSVNIL